MPFNTASDLPDSVKNVLPDHAQDIFKAAFNSAFEKYDCTKDRNLNDSSEEVAFKVAWSAVKKSYQKGDDGRWLLKD